MEKKKILFVLFIITTTFLFLGRAKAVVMWMQCTDTKDGVMEYNEEFDGDSGGERPSFKEYNTIALIDTYKENKVTAPLIYKGTNFFGPDDLGPTLIHRFKGVTDTNKACWYSSPFSKGKDNDPMTDCDDEPDVELGKLAEGFCPKSIYAVDGEDNTGIIIDWNVYEKDMVVFSGTKSINSSNREELKSAKMIAYKVHDAEENNDFWMIEAYGQDGSYGYIHTFVGGDYEKLSDKLGLYNGDDDNDFFSVDNGDGYAHEYVDWSMYTQMYRIYIMGDNARHFFKITDDDKYPQTLLIGASNNSDKTLSLIKESKIYYDLDGKTTSSQVIKDWYTENEELYKGEIEVLSKFKSGAIYSKLIETSQKISDAVDEGSRYEFTSDYTALDMVDDLNSAYTELEKISDNNSSFKKYDNNCKEVVVSSDSDASFSSLDSAYTYFNCKTFGTPDIKKYAKNKKSGYGTKNSGMVATVLAEYVQEQLNEQSGTSMDIQTILQEKENNVMILAKAAAYIKQNNLVDSSKIDELAKNYLKLVEKFGYSLVVDCETLIGDELKERIESISSIIKIAVPILLIGFGIIDFTKALFAGADDKMKKAQTDFIKRLGVALIFFLTPTIVNLLLSIANKVWSFIEPNSCNLKF